MSQRVLPIPLAPAAITVRSAGDGAIIVLTISGTWDTALRSETFKVLQGCLAAHPAGLLIDLTALHDGEARSAPAWTSTRNLGADMQPPTLVALCIPPEALLAGRLQQTGTQRLLPIYAKLQQARTALDNRILSADRMVTNLTAAPHAPRMARQLVDEACRAWHLAIFQFSARLVVPHGTPAISGLHVVQALSARWGTVPTSDGKMVWANPRADGSHQDARAGPSR